MSGTASKLPFSCVFTRLGGMGRPPRVPNFLGNSWHVCTGITGRHRSRRTACVVPAPLARGDRNQHIGQRHVAEPRCQRLAAVGTGAARSARTRSGRPVAREIGDRIGAARYQSGSLGGLLRWRTPRYRCHTRRLLWRVSRSRGWEVLCHIERRRSPDTHVRYIDNARADLVRCRGACTFVPNAPGAGARSKSDARARQQKRNHQRNQFPVRHPPLLRCPGSGRVPQPMWLLSHQKTSWCRIGVDFCGKSAGGRKRNRTAVRGFAVPCIATLPSGPASRAVLYADPAQEGQERSQAQLRVARH